MRKKGNILTGRVSKTLKVYCTWKLLLLWLQKSLYFPSPVSRWQEPKQKQDGSQIKELSNASEARLLLLFFGKNSSLNTSKLWIRARLDFKAPLMSSPSLMVFSGDLRNPRSQCGSFGERSLPSAFWWLIHPTFIHVSFPLKKKKTRFNICWEHFDLLSGEFFGCFSN